MAVLNALRHQRSFHRGQAGSRAGSRNVLNALRHQRSFHMDNAGDSAGQQMCSTPCGIKDRFTFPLQRSPAPRTVLNALRHQRSFHYNDKVIGLNRPECSTPCGIKDRFTRTGEIARMFLRCAQRLAASKIVSQLLTSGLLQSQCQCSTPCGIKDRFTALHAR